MTLSEFKAWFEGFTEAMDGPPGPKAWERIKARVGEITSEPMTIREIYRDWPWWRGPQYSTNRPVLADSIVSPAQYTLVTGDIASSLNSGTMFADIGRQEAVQIRSDAG